MVINFWDFSGATSLLKGLHISFFGFFSSFDGFFVFIYIFPMYKKANYLSFYGRLSLFKGLYLLFLQNVPGGRFIQRGFSQSTLTSFWLF